MREVTGRGWRMIHGDADEVVWRLPRADHVITDPPYGFGAYKDDVDAGLVPSVLGALEFTGALAVFGYPEILVGWCRDIGRVPDEWITWWPSNAAAKAGGRTKALPRQTECIAIFGDVPGAKALVAPRSFAGVRLPQNRALSPDARLGDVWRDASPGIAFNARLRLHINEKPESLLIKLIRLVSPLERETVLDPFAGSATTGVAALRLGRSFVGVEIDAATFELACERLAAEEQNLSLHASRAGQLPMFGGRRS